MKKFLLLFVVFCLLFSAMAVAADNTCTTTEPEVKGPFTVTYEGNYCLAAVPTDCDEYMAGDEVTVKFDPVQYMDNLLFYGWDWDNDGIADFGYEYNTFKMPENDVTMKAICISPWPVQAAETEPEPAPAPAPAPVLPPFAPCPWFCF